MQLSRRSATSSLISASAAISLSCTCFPFSQAWPTTACWIVGYLDLPWPSLCAFHPPYELPPCAPVGCICIDIATLVGESPRRIQSLLRRLSLRRWSGCSRCLRILRRDSFFSLPCLLRRRPQAAYSRRRLRRRRGRCDRLHSAELLFWSLLSAVSAPAQRQVDVSRSRRPVALLC